MGLDLLHEYRGRDLEEHVGNEKDGQRRVRLRAVQSQILRQIEEKSVSDIDALGRRLLSFLLANDRHSWCLPVQECDEINDYKRRQDTKIHFCNQFGRDEIFTR